MARQFRFAPSDPNHHQSRRLGERERTGLSMGRDNSYDIGWMDENEEAKRGGVILKDSFDALAGKNSGDSLSPPKFVGKKLNFSQTKHNSQNIGKVIKSPLELPRENSRENSSKGSFFPRSRGNTVYKKGTITGLSPQTSKRSKTPQVMKNDPRHGGAQVFTYKNIEPMKSINRSSSTSKHDSKTAALLKQ
jgi:hypothetical protein